MKNLKMMVWFKKMSSIFMWMAFAIGLITLALMLWSKLWPSLNQRFLEKPAASEQAGNAAVRGLVPRIHAEFVQNLNNQIASSQSNDSISSMAYDTRNGFFLVGRESGTVDIWDGKQANAMREIKAHKLRASQLTFTSDGRMFFSHSNLEDGIHLLDTASGVRLHTIERARGPVVETSDPNLFVVAASSGLRIFNLATQEVLPNTYRQVGDVVTALTYDAPTDQLALGTASGAVEIWRLKKIPFPALEQVAAIRPYAVGNWVMAVQFFDSGRSIYSLPQRGNLDEWSVPRLKPLRSREISLRFVSSSVFIPEKGQLAMVGYRKGDENASSNFLEIFNLDNGGESLADMKRDGSCVIVHLPPISAIMAGQNLTLSLIDIAKAK